MFIFSLFLAGYEAHLPILKCKALSYDLINWELVWYGMHGEARRALGYVRTLPYSL